MSIQTFWSEKRWTRKFGEWGKEYTIVKDPRGGGYHIGLDSAAVGDIPCLVAGVVVTAYKTGTMGWCVEIDTGAARIGRGRYFTYCHIAGDRVPTRGQFIEAGARVGRTAMGPRGVAYTSAEFPGTAWNGVHCHLVISDHLNAAWTIVKGRTLAAFYDPAPIIRAVLAAPAGGNGRPLPPTNPTIPTVSEEDELMGAKDDIIAAVNAQSDANTARLRLEIRGHLFYDAGADGTVRFEDTKHAAIINAAGKIMVMETPPVGQEASMRRDTYKYLDTSRPAEANRVGLTTREFWNKIKDELTARGNDFYDVPAAQAWFGKRQEQIAAQS